MMIFETRLVMVRAYVTAGVSIEMSVINAVHVTLWELGRLRKGAHLTLRYNVDRVKQRTSFGAEMEESWA